MVCYGWLLSLLRWMCCGITVCCLCLLLNSVVCAVLFELKCLIVWLIVWIDLYLFVVVCV